MIRCSPMRHFFFLYDRKRGTESCSPKSIAPLHMLRKNVLAIAPKSEGGHYTNLEHKALGFSSVGNWLHLCTLFLKILFMLYIYSPFFQTIQVIGGFSLRNKSGQENQRNLAMGN